MFNGAVRFSGLRPLGRPPLRLNERFFWKRLGLSLCRVTTEMYDHDYPNCLELNKLSFNCISFTVVLDVVLEMLRSEGVNVCDTGQSEWKTPAWKA